MLIPGGRAGFVPVVQEACREGRVHPGWEPSGQPGGRGLGNVESVSAHRSRARSKSTCCGGSPPPFPSQAWPFLSTYKNTVQVSARCFLSAQPPMQWAAPELGPALQGGVGMWAGVPDGQSGGIHTLL